MSDVSLPFAQNRPGLGAVHRAAGLFARMVLILVPLWAVWAPGLAAGAKVETKTFNAYYASQSAKIYDHLLKVTDYYASLAKDGNTERVKDVLALRASLAACWEMVLNAGDMVYIYDLVDPGCSGTVTQIGGLIKTGLATVAGKLDKELQWMRLVEKNVSDLPVSVELGQAFRDIEAMAAYFRTAAPTFEAPAGGETRQSVKKQGVP